MAPCMPAGAGAGGGRERVRQAGECSAYRGLQRERGAAWGMHAPAGGWNGSMGLLGCCGSAMTCEVCVGRPRTCLLCSALCSEGSRGCHNAQPLEGHNAQPLEGATMPLEGATMPLEGATMPLDGATMPSL